MAQADPINMRSFLRFVAGGAIGAVTGLVAGYAVHALSPNSGWRTATMAEQAATSAEEGPVRTVVDRRGLQVLQRCRGACDEVGS